jgi:hypothetical protein
MKRGFLYAVMKTKLNVRPQGKIKILDSETVLWRESHLCSKTATMGKLRNTNANKIQIEGHWDRPKLRRESIASIMLEFQEHCLRRTGAKTGTVLMVHIHII